MNIPIKYIPKRLTNKDKKEQLKQLKKSRGLYKKGKYHTRKKAKSFKNKKSSHVKNAMKIYNVKDVVPSKILSKKTGCTLSSLNKIVKKGQGAYYIWIKTKSNSTFMGICSFSKRNNRW